jgi:hypothetical protein
MGLVTEVVKRVEIPHEPHEWIEFRKLSWRQLEQAGEAATNRSFERLKQMGGDLLTALRTAGEQQTADPLTQYDKLVVLEHGVRAWSYEAKVETKSICALDEQTADWAFGEILELSKPRSEVDSKNA